ncbi:hypothetical protein [Streptomyces aureoverticillatus]|uniref:hypothetical protein n=1 Tax=Streptomyces aureoverticillatus TaxID=66871 RepID=UPI0013DC8354|nr:hypothetical protein [Streptomyces aureoverticillatus]QIB49467.1 hypothetical protein G3H79_41110 [Streptomyces aureoverticillatus]
MKVSRWRRAAHRIRATTRDTGRALARRGRRTRDWAHARRRPALGQVLRGICFGCGSGLVTLFIFWLTHR